LKIADHFKKRDFLLSFEFFPPKKKESEQVLHETVDALRRYHPDFVSITYGAGGSTREKTLQWTLDIKKKHGLEVMMHLTCIASTKKEIAQIVQILKASGIENVLALRGDPPQDRKPGKGRRDLKHAFELVEYLRHLNGFSIGVAGYPEGHPEAVSIDEDLLFLKKKVDAGAQFVITQLFFENRYFLDFEKRARAAGIGVPIIPGIMPIVNLGQVKKFTQMCGATVPSRIMRLMEGKDAGDTLRIGVDLAIKQCSDLIEAGVPGLHFYTLNRNQSTQLILEGLNPYFPGRKDAGEKQS